MSWFGLEWLMIADIYPLHFLLVTLSGWMNRRQQMVVEYLVEEPSQPSYRRYRS